MNPIHLLQELTDILILRDDDRLRDFAKKLGNPSIQAEDKLAPVPIEVRGIDLLKGDRVVGSKYPKDAMWFIYSNEETVASVDETNVHFESGKEDDTKDLYLVRLPRLALQKEGEIVRGEDLLKGDEIVGWVDNGVGFWYPGGTTWTVTPTSDIDEHQFYFVRKPRPDPKALNPKTPTPYEKTCPEDPEGGERWNIPAEWASLSSVRGKDRYRASDGVWITINPWAGVPWGPVIGEMRWVKRFDYKNPNAEFSPSKIARAVGNFIAIDNGYDTRLFRVDAPNGQYSSNEVEACAAEINIACALAFEKNSADVESLRKMYKDARKAAGRGIGHSQACRAQGVGEDNVCECGHDLLRKALGLVSSPQEKSELHEPRGPNKKVG